MLRSFGIDITGCTFGLSCLSASTDNAEENFIHPEDTEEFMPQKKSGTMQDSVRMLPRHNYELRYKEESAQEECKNVNIENVSP